MGIVSDIVDGVFGGGQEAPDYSPVANASAEAARLSTELGREQLAEGRRQYDNNVAITRPIVDAQLDILNQTKQQGQDYYDYGKSFRDLEGQMKDQAQAGDTVAAGERAAIENMGRAQADNLLQSTTQFENSQDMNAARLRDLQMAQGNELNQDTAAYLARTGVSMDQLKQMSGDNAAELRGRVNNFENNINQDVGLATGGNSGIRDKFAADIEDDVGRAVADSRVGQTQALNTAARQAARYGLSLPANMDALTTTNAAALAAAANNTRNASIDKYRGIVTNGIGLKQNVFNQTQGALSDAMSRGEGAIKDNLALDANKFSTGMNAKMAGMGLQSGAIQNQMASNRDTFVTGNAAKTDAFNRDLNAISNSRNQRIQDTSLDWAKKLDVTGMVRGMPGASQGAYGVAVGAGNSAAQNQMAPGNNYLNAVQSGIGTMQRGQQIQLGGLTSILNNQNQAFLTTRGQNMDVIGTAAGAGAAFAMSDERLKVDVVPVGVHHETGLNLYEFAYASDPARRYLGVMAQEVQKVRPDAVYTDRSGFLGVNYSALGLRMTEVIR